MPSKPLSNSQSLRVIGQQLSSRGVNSFHLAKKDDEFMVLLHRSDNAGNATDRISRNSLMSILKKGLGSDGSEKENPMPTCFNASQIVWSDAENQLKRGQPTAMPDAHDLSTVLRVVGDYIDRKLAGDFALSCDAGLVTVSYGEKNESFGTENLYDLGVHMYLRRSNRG